MEDQPIIIPKQELLTTIYTSIENFNTLYQANNYLFKETLKYIFSKKQHKEIEGSFRKTILALLDQQIAINYAAKHNQIHDQLKYRLQALIAFFDSAHI